MARRSHGPGVLAKIRVNAVAPGFFLTNQNRFLLTDKETGELTKRGNQIISHTPMARFGEPKDLFGAILWLLSPPLNSSPAQSFPSTADSQPTAASSSRTRLKNGRRIQLRRPLRSQPPMAYNADMGESELGPQNEITDWLRSGGLVIAASERAARALTADFHRQRGTEGLTAWPAPAIYDWQTFLRTTWNDRARNDGRLILDSLQEQSIWATIAGL